MQLSILRIVLYIFIPFAPLYGRVVNFNGSLDHSWTLFPLFNIFPFSIAPVVLMAIGKIKPGKGTKPYDHYMWIPIFIRFLGSFIVSMVIQNPMIKTVIMLLLSIFSIMIPNLIRRRQNCKDQKDGNNNSYTVMSGKQWYKSFVDSIFELGIGELFTILMTFIPFIGIGFKILGMIPFVGKFVNDIIWSFGFICAYIIVNMYNQDNMSKLCYPEKLNTTTDIIKLVFGLVFVVIGGIFSGRGGGMGNFGKFGKALEKVKETVDETVNDE